MTGCEGFLGSHLAELLIGMMVDVTGTAFGATGNIDHLEGKIRLVRGDLRRSDWVDSLVEETRPELIFHLAAQSFITVSWRDPEQTLTTNIIGTLNLLEALRKVGTDPRVIVVGSSAVLGPRSSEQMPLREGDSFLPTSTYAVSKVAEEMLGYCYWRAYSMQIVRVRPFNMTGPRKVDDACSDFARQIAEVKAGRRNVLHVGNLDTVRDFTDGRDAARALWTIASKASPGEVYNLCSGIGRRMRDVLERFIQIAAVQVTYRTIPELLRQFDDPIYVGDSSKLETLGWKPSIPFDTTLRDMLDYWGQRFTQSEETLGSVETLR